MEKCPYWNKYTVKKWDAWRNMFLPADREECWGTKEREEVRCGGCQAECSIYPEIREKATKTITRAEAEKKLGMKIID